MIRHLGGLSRTWRSPLLALKMVLLVGTVSTPEQCPGETMDDLVSWLRMTELDRISFSEMGERIAEAEAEALRGEPRRYPGYPTWPLPRTRRRWWPSLDSTLHARRCHWELQSTLPDARTLGRLLQHAHGNADELFRGPTPSAGGLQALELYLAHWQTAWLPPGAYHYDRRGHYLSQIVVGADANAWGERVPSLRQVSGGAVLWLLVGDARRVAAKYGERGERFLLLEAGHLMQNLCLLSASLGLCTVPLGGCLEREAARELRLLATDRVLYAGVCGRVSKWR
jgi:SagB-type dehydrogenase family enzyme